MAQNATTIARQLLAAVMAGKDTTEIRQALVRSLYAPQPTVAAARYTPDYDDEGRPAHWGNA